MSETINEHHFVTALKEVNKQINGQTVWMGNIESIKDGEFPDTVEVTVTLGVNLNSINQAHSLKDAPKTKQFQCDRCSNIYPPDIKFCGRCGSSKFSKV